MSATADTDELQTMSLSEAARRLRMTRATLMTWALLGQIGYATTIDQKIRFTDRDVQTLASRLKRPLRRESSVA